MMEKPLRCFMIFLRSVCYVDRSVQSSVVLELVFMRWNLQLMAEHK